jgi:hypothetical protein
LEFYVQLLRPHGLVFALTCQLWDLIYTQVCTFPNPFQPIEFNTDGFQSRSQGWSMEICPKK